MTEFFHADDHKYVHGRERERYCRSVNRALSHPRRFPSIVPEQDLSPAIRAFLARHIRSVEQLEILLLFSREPAAIWSEQNVYDAILSTPQSVMGWLNALTREGLLEKVGDSAAGYRCCRDERQIAQIAELAELYRIKPVRIIETIYKPKLDAAQSFADSFKINPPPQHS